MTKKSWRLTRVSHGLSDKIHVHFFHAGTRARPGIESFIHTQSHYSPHRMHVSRRCDMCLLPKPREKSKKTEAETPSQKQTAISLCLNPPVRKMTTTTLPRHEETKNISIHTHHRSTTPSNPTDDPKTKRSTHNHHSSPQRKPIHIKPPRHHGQTPSPLRLRPRHPDSILHRAAMPKQRILLRLGTLGGKQ